ncbi:MAG TPA: primosomal protein N' [Bacillota bacterium]|nr:MAG: Primosomal protein N' [Firmicutes bacterium ADurb.Bin153]HNV34432.1 primosomal protein N' [Bacillota bacterium]
MGHLYAQVAVDIVHRQLDQLFDYEVPVGLDVKVGSKVSVPFRNRIVDGYVFGLSGSTSMGKLRRIIPPKAGLLTAPAELMELAGWMASRYLCLRIEAAKLLFPPGNVPLAPGLSPTKELLGDPVSFRTALRRSPVRLRLLDFVLAEYETRKTVPLKEALEKSGASASAAQSLVKEGALERSYVTRKPAVERSAAEVRDVTLTGHQKEALAAIGRAMAEGGTVLLNGVTGSGKTEVYIRALKEAISAGKQGILLVPDIALTPQVSDIVRAHFGSRVAVLHSALSDSERAYHWYMAMKGEVDVVVGARSAVFAPLERLGIIIMDEEHDSSYKQEESPRYHAREVAARRAGLTGAALVLGSATPSLESYSRAKAGEIALCGLPERVDGRGLPEMVVVDRRDEIKAGNYSFLSRRLKTEMDAALVKGGRVMLFLNRRGYSPLVLCRDCGYTMKCPDCDVSLVYHSDTKTARCHYCCHEEAVPASCPSCKGKRLKMYGVGTQRMEEELSKLFPDYGVARMDVDSTRTRGSHRRILDDFRSGRAPILVGTQMIAKGLDIPEVTLVGIIAADMSLKFPDFRAAERTYQLVTQVSGRAGRGAEPGLVIVQTYNPDHYSLKAAVDGDYEGFYDIEAKSRKALGYPPFAAMARVLVVSGSPASAEAAAASIAGGIRKDPGGIRVLGPSPAPLSRVEGKSRWHILLLCEDRETLARKLEGLARGGEEHEGCSIRIDFDPQSTL